MFTKQFYRGASMAVALTLALSSANAAHAGGITSMVKGVFKVTGDVVVGAGRAVGTTASATANAVGNTTTAAVEATGDLLGMHGKNEGTAPAKVAAAPKPAQEKVQEKIQEKIQEKAQERAPEKIQERAPVQVKTHAAKTATLSTEGTRISPPMPLEDQPIVDAPQVRTLPQTRAAMAKAKPVVQQQPEPVAMAATVATAATESPSWNDTAPRYAIKTTPLVPNGK